MGAAMLVGGAQARAPVLRPHRRERPGARCCCSRAPRSCCRRSSSSSTAAACRGVGEEEVNFDNDVETMSCDRRGDPALAPTPRACCSALSTHRDAVQPRAAERGARRRGVADQAVGHHARDRRRRRRRDVRDPRRLDHRGVREHRHQRVLRRRHRRRDRRQRGRALGGRSTSRRKDKMDLAVNIAIGSSAQIALFVAPRPGPALVRRRRRTRWRSCSTASSSSPCSWRSSSPNFVVNEGESTWFEGLQLLGAVRPAWARLLLRLMGDWLATGRRSSRPSSSSSGSTCTSSRAAASRAFREGVVWSIGWLVAQPARRRRHLLVLDGPERRGQLHDRLPDRALAVARQPLRLPPAVRVLRGARRAARAAAVLGHRLRARRCAAWRSSAASR